MEIRANYQSDAYLAVLGALIEAPRVSPRGMLCKELSERVSVVIKHPAAGFVDVTGRRLVHAITAIEAASLVGQTSVPELITDRVGAFAPYANDGVFWGAYGPRIAGDLGNVVSLLKRDPDSRQAVLSIFDSDRDLGRESVRDVPCTVAIQFFLRVTHIGPVLSMWVVMRSNDAWLGLPYDLGQFSILQMAVAQALDARVGPYTHSVGSMHLYERDWEPACAVGDPVYHSGYSNAASIDRAFNSFSIEETSSRARRILLGQTIADPSTLELWMTQRIAERSKVADNLARLA